MSNVHPHLAYLHPERRAPKVGDLHVPGEWPKEEPAQASVAKKPRRALDLFLEDAARGRPNVHLRKALSNDICHEKAAHRAKPLTSRPSASAPHFAIAMGA